MEEPIWVLRAVVEAVHDAQLAEHGGAPGVRDVGLLESALARPANLHAYGESALCVLAAAYAFGIVRNHPFVDGNKRTAFLAAYVFLRLNGLDLVADEISATTAVLALASGEMTEADFAAWLRALSVRTESFER
ncbi:MAG: type II toxin-antitoxin system death-on-curing family toxin [Methylocystis sp.]